MVISKRYTIKQKLVYYNNRINDFSLTSKQRKFAKLQVKNLSDYLSEGIIAEISSKDLPKFNLKNKYHPVIINKLNSDNSVYVNAVSHSKFSKCYKSKSLGLKSYVNLEAYKRTVKQEKINSKNLFESKLKKSLDLNEFKEIKNNTLYK